MRVEFGINAAEKFYYCPGCKKFHKYDSTDHTTVNRKLCFYCGKIQSKKTKIIGDNKGHSQICTECQRKYGFY